MYYIFYCISILSLFTPAAQAMGYDCDKGFHSERLNETSEDGLQEQIATFKKNTEKLLEQDDLSDLGNTSPLLSLMLYKHCSNFLPLLLAKKADPNVASEFDTKATPLNRAIVAQKTIAMTMLLQKGAKPTPEDLSTALTFGFIGGVELLLEKGVDPNAFIKDPLGHPITPLMKAFTGNHPSLIENRQIIIDALKKRGAELTAKEVIDLLERGFIQHAY